MSRKEKVASETDDSVIASRLRYLLEERDMNQNQLAKATKLQRQTISNYTNGQSVPDGNNLIKISKALNVSVDYILGLSDVESIDSSIKGAVQCTGLDDDAINHLINLEKNQKEMASDIIRSSFFTMFIDSFSETFVYLREAEKQADIVLETYDDSTSLSELESKASIYTELCSAKRVLLGSKYGVVEAAIRILNDILDLDNNIEVIENKRRSFNSKALMDRMIVLYNEGRQKNGLDKA